MLFLFFKVFFVNLERVNTLNSLNWIQSFKVSHEIMKFTPWKYWLRSEYLGTRRLSCSNFPFCSRIFSKLLLFNGRWDFADVSSQVDMTGRNTVTRNSYLEPLSIIIIGIGDADFTAMETLDSDEYKLVSSISRKPIEVCDSTENWSSALIAMLC